MFAPEIIHLDRWNFHVFSRFISVGWSHIHEKVNIKSIKELKSTGSDYHLGQTLSPFEARMRNLCNKEPLLPSGACEGFTS